MFNRGSLSDILLYYLWNEEVNSKDTSWNTAVGARIFLFLRWDMQSLFSWSLWSNGVKKSSICIQINTYKTNSGYENAFLKKQKEQKDVGKVTLGASQSCCH